VIRYHIGVDPGLSGAWAIVDEIGCLHSWGRVRKAKHGRRHIVDAHQLVADIRAAGVILAAAHVEDVHAMPGQGVSSMFSFGRSLGAVEGALAALDIPTHYLRPKQWQAAMLEGLPRGSQVKESAVKRASLLWPQLADTLKVKAAGGIADAALIAETGRRMADKTRTDE
jgi:crossover junction endodeoxyribonuclease RuvC